LPALGALGTIKRMVNLILALIWAVFALGWFLLPVVIPGVSTPKIGGTEIPLGWFAALLCGLNLLRWWTARSAQHRRLALQQEQRQRWQDKLRSRPAQAPDPTFDFTREPPRPRGDRQDNAR